MVTLGEAFGSIRNGKSIKQGGDDGLPITRIETIAKGAVNFGKMGYAGIHDVDSVSNYLLQEGDILMSHINSEKHLGKVALFANSRPVIHGMNLLRLRTSNELNSKFAVLFFRNNLFKSQLHRITKKSVNQASFSVTGLKELKIPLPPMEEQRRIVEILDAAQGLIDQRKEQIALMEQLVQSLFYDMFGDPVTNPMGWEVKKLENLGKIQTGNTPSRSNPKNYGVEIEWIKTNNIVTSKIYVEEASEHLSSYGKRSARVVQPGAILVCCIAGSKASIGRAAMTNREVAFNQQINAISPNDAVNGNFLLYHFRIGQKLIQAASTNSMKGMVNKTAFSNVAFLFPPLSLQTEFADRVSAIESQKAAMTASLSELKDTFNALMQRAFKAEL